MVRKVDLLKINNVTRESLKMNIEKLITCNLHEILGFLEETN
jgi:hypothetical protein